MFAFLKYLNILLVYYNWLKVYCEAYLILSAQITGFSRTKENVEKYFFPRCRRLVLQ